MSVDVYTAVLCEIMSTMSSPETEKCVIDLLKS